MTSAPAFAIRSMAGASGTPERGRRESGPADGDGRGQFSRRDGRWPGAWEEIRGQSKPMLFNMSLLGGGPIMELMVARRAFADGLRPSVVLFEYWPPYFYSEGNWTESKRIVIDRLSPLDRPIVREFFPNHAAVERGSRRSTGARSGTRASGYSFRSSPGGSQLPPHRLDVERRG